LRGDPSTANAIGWTPEFSFRSLVDQMIDADLAAARDERLIRGAG
jgi:GDP-D-mannose dehydratase